MRHRSYSGIHRTQAGRASIERKRAGNVSGYPSHAGRAAAREGCRTVYPYLVLEVLGRQAALLDDGLKLLDDGHLARL